MNKPLRIGHLADIHIFNSKRHDEHKIVLKNTLIQLVEKKVDLIYLAGDIQDSKSKLSPEQIEIINWFLYELSLIAPVIIILGNHDTNLQNKQRLDSLTPIINNLNPVNPIYYLKDSGIYNLYDIDWVVWSRLDDVNPVENFIKKNYTIGCYHGVVQGCKLDSGYNKLHSDFTVDTFKDCDLVLLGDIHNQQFFRNNEIAYAGSLLQVTVAEAEDKGFLLWEWNGEKYIPNHVNVFNPFGYKTIKIQDLDNFNLNEIKLDSEDKVCRLVYVGDEMLYSFTKFNEIKKQVKGKYLNNPILLEKNFSKRKTVNKTDNIIKSTDFFSDYFKSKNISNEVVENLKELDLYYNSLLTLNDFQGNEYCLKEIEIDNFLCYGPNNIVDFEDIKGLVGLFAKNGSGKSSFFDAIMFCLFNKTPKDADGAIKLINDQLDVDKCFVQIKLTINGVLWTIKRTVIAKKDKSGASIKVEVFEGDQARHLESRPQTDKQILQPLLGDEDIFLMTVLASQKNSVEFVKIENAKRLDLIIRFLGILLYDAKFRLVDKDLKQEDTVRGILNTELEKLTSLQELEKKIEDLEAETIVKSSIIGKLNKVIKKRKELLKIAVTKKDELNVISVLQTEDALTKNLQSYKRLLKEAEEKQKVFKLTTWTENISIEKWNYKRTEQSQLTKLAELNVAIKQLENQIEEDFITTCPNCNHEWHAIDLEKLKETLSIKKIERDNLDKIIKDEKTEQDRLEKLKETINQEEKDLKKIKSDIEINTTNINNIEKQLKIIEENKEKLELKKKYDLEIENLENKLEINRNLKSSYEAIIAGKEQQVIALQEKIESYKKKVTELEEKDQLITNLTLYKNAMHRTGIPSMILQNFIPLINFELNGLVNELFDYSLEFELDESTLNIYYIKENLNKIVKRSISQACGMEETIINLAIRAALTKISLLPKPSLLLLDEMFSMLDEINLDKMHELIIKLKDQYQNIILITHTDEIKEWPEHFIELCSLNGVTSII